MKTVLIKYEYITRRTVIEIDGVRQQKVKSYTLHQQPHRLPLFTIVQDGEFNPETSSTTEITTSFVPTKIDFISI